MKNKYTYAVFSNLKTFILLLLSLPLTVSAQELMRANVFIVNSSGVTLMDGNLTNYDNIYSNAVDINDAWKMTNPGVNFGILREAQNLVVERRSIIGNSDTTFFRMWNMSQHNYRIKFMLKNLNHPGMYAVVKDKFLNSETPVALNDTTYYDFTVNSNPASANQFRFQLIYNSLGASAPVSVNFTGINAQRKGKTAVIEWGVANEESMLSYTIEHSADGNHFTNIHQLKPANTVQYKTYNYTDLQALNGDNFYRIKGLSMSGRVQYSPIAKVSAVNADEQVNIYPNPVTNKIVQLLFNGQPIGNYHVVLLYGNGSRKELSPIQLSSSQSSISISLPQDILAGIYQLQLTGPGKLKITKVIEVL